MARSQLIVLNIINSLEVPGNILIFEYNIHLLYFNIFSTHSRFLSNFGLYNPSCCKAEISLREKVSF